MAAFSLRSFAIFHARLEDWIQDAALTATVERPDFKAAMGSPPVVAVAHHSGFRIIRVTEDGFEHRWCTFADVPETLDEAFEVVQTPKDRHNNL